MEEGRTSKKEQGEQEGVMAHNTEKERKSVEELKEMEKQRKKMELLFE